MVTRSKGNRPKRHPKGQGKMNARQRFAQHTTKLAQFSDRDLVDMMYDAEATRDAATGHDRLAAQLVCSALYEELERRHPEIVDDIDEALDSDDLEFACKSYGDLIALALGH